MFQFTCTACAQTCEFDSETFLRSCPHCGEQIPVDRIDLAPDHVIADYRIIKVLGRGGMGTVYRAHHQKMGREIALKIMSPGTSASPKRVDRFNKEVRMLSKLNHPNIATAFDAGEDQGFHYLAMELIEGDTLTMSMLKRGPVSEADILDTIQQTATALQAAWEKHRLVHRDIKPNNLMRDVDGNIQILDFGLGTASDPEAPSIDNITATEAVIGTPNFMSPEQLAGQEDIDFRTDIYALGCTAHYLASGDLPFNANSPVAVIHNQITNDLPDLRRDRPDLSPAFSRLVRKMIAKDRHKRHDSYDALLQETRSIKETNAGERRILSHRFLLPALVVLALLFAAILLRPTAKEHSPDIPSTQVVSPSSESTTDESSLETAPPSSSNQIGQANTPQALPGMESSPSPTLFKNSLGMQFSSVPILASHDFTGVGDVGRAPAKPLLFSIWETRQSDFTAFTREKKMKWNAWRNKARQDQLPANWVCWEHAVEFAQWLTEREQQLGTIKPNDHYRLPTDHEWSCATGIGDGENEEDVSNDSLPNDRQIKRFAWGSQWPPPTDSGNFFGQEIAGTIHHWPAHWTPIPNYRDAYPDLAPVGQFKPNAFGLYDLDGNVEEWCQDQEGDPEADERILRGGSFISYQAADVTRSTRKSHPCDIAGPNHGFRLVLERGNDE